MLTKAMLEAMPAHTIFAAGTAINSPEDIYITNHDVGKELSWIAKRWEIHDRAIYIGRQDQYWMVNSRTTCVAIAETGDKVVSKEFIQALVPCDAEAFKLYRH